VLETLPEDRFEASLLVIIHSGITAEWLLRRVATSLGVPDPSTDKLELLGQLYQRLLEIHELGKKAVVLVDEAQMLQSREIMEELRGLLNIEVPGQKLITFVFFGLPDIEKNIELDPPLAQRVAMKYRLEPFDLSSTTAYIQHRLRLAEARDGLFSHDAIATVHRYSGGTPRVINTVCDNALLEAFFAGRYSVGAATVERVARNLGLRAELPPLRTGSALTAEDLDEIDRYLEGLGKL
jgi:type II secretory pathway predicted ATPase ExeA